VNPPPAWGRRRERRGVELHTLGFTGSVLTVRRYLRPLRDTTTTAASTVSPRPAVPKPRQVVRWIMTERGKLDADEQAQLSHALAGCRHLQAALLTA
jgi:hypothetical protein